MQDLKARMYIGNIQNRDDIKIQIEEFLNSIGSYTDLELNFKFGDKVFGFFTVN